MKHYHYTLLGWLCLIIRYNLTDVVGQFVFGFLGLGLFIKALTFTNKKGGGV